MKEAQIHKDGSVTIEEVPIPEITDPHHLIIKVVVSGCNPKDWKMPAGMLSTIHGTMNSGDDIAGTVHAVGPAVTEFRVGDRVAALHELGTSGGSYAEYALAHDFSTFHLSDETSFEEAATLPMAAFMSAIGLFGMLKVTTPWAPLHKETPLVIYGAASAVGSTAVQWAQLVNIHPLICVAGRGIQFVEGLIDKSKGDAIVDYRKGNIVEDLKSALGGRKLFYAFDAVSEKGSWQNLAQVLEPTGSRITLVLTGHKSDIPEGIEQSVTMAGSLWKVLKSRHEGVDAGVLGLGEGGRDFSLAMSRLIGKMVQEGRLKSFPYVSGDKGLHDLEYSLGQLRQNKVSAHKFVFRIADTPDFT